ncbi:MAG TPA: LysM peptidoglycan-binding domain-containing protein [Pyrinomonadaceae bacterium]|jgi:nucleoid-associated protein YgaU
MGIFDQMFGTGAAAAVSQQSQFDQLKQKYQSVLHTLEQENVRVQNLHVENGKLLIRGAAPSEEAKNKVWDQIKAVDSNYGDLQAEINVDASQSHQSGGTYTVKPGDSLWKIAQNHLGDGNRYMEVFYANRDQMDSPKSVIHPGDELKLPPK